ncbi:MAG: glycosyltransferase family 1 protein [Burkholderiales bacterium]
MLTVVADKRWGGEHGIGRFSRKVLGQIAHRELDIGGRPMDPFDPIRLSIALRRIPRGNVFFSPGYNAPFLSNQRFLFTVHDLNHIDRPENSSVPKRIYYALVLKRACLRAAKVLTVSEYARQRIIRWSGVPDQQVVNVGNGVDDAFTPGSPAASSGRPYFLCVSNRRPHKNESRVLSALAASGLPADVELVLTGPPTQGLNDEIRARGLDGRVRFTGTVSDEELAELYRGAIGLVFPSLYEGFGLPVVEAMACGTPVITSTTTALPEIAGDAALLVDPMRVDEIAEAMTRLHDDQALRIRLREAGLRRATQFTWSSVADRVSAAIADIR